MTAILHTYICVYHVTFVFYVQMGAVTRMCKHLRFSSKVVGYAGTKDKRGVTSQWCTVKRKSIEELRSFNRPLGAFQVHTLDGQAYITKAKSYFFAVFLEICVYVCVCFFLF